MNRKFKFWEVIMADLSRLGQPSKMMFLKQYFFPRGGTFPYVFWLRMTQKTRCGGLLAKLFFPIVYVMYRHYEFKYGVHANPNIEIGEGLFVVHGGNVHLNCDKVGRNLTVYQGVTLGIKDGARPIVGDNVTIYPNAIIVGGIKVGDNAVVGALSYVSHDVPEKKTVVGAPARAIGEVQ